MWAGLTLGLVAMLAIGFAFQAGLSPLDMASNFVRQAEEKVAYKREYSALVGHLLAARELHEAGEADTPAGRRALVHFSVAKERFERRHRWGLVRFDPEASEEEWAESMKHPFAPPDPGGVGPGDQTAPSSTLPSSANAASTEISYARAMFAQHFENTKALRAARRAWVGLASPPSFPLEEGGRKGAVASAAAALGNFFAIVDGLGEGVQHVYPDPMSSQTEWLARAEAKVDLFLARAEPSSSAFLGRGQGTLASFHARGSEFVLDAKALVDAGRLARDAASASPGRPDSTADLFQSLARGFERGYAVQLSPFDPVGRDGLEEWAAFLMSVSDAAFQVALRRVLGNHVRPDMMIRPGTGLLTKMEEEVGGADFGGYSVSRGEGPGEFESKGPDPGLN